MPRTSNDSLQTTEVTDTFKAWKEGSIVQDQHTREAAVDWNAINEESNDDDDDDSGPEEDGLHDAESHVPLDVHAQSALGDSHQASRMVGHLFFLNSLFQST